MWIDEAPGVVARDDGDLRLAVKNVGGLVRYLVLRGANSDDGVECLIGSGTSQDIGAAMRSAESMASRARTLWADRGADVI